MRFLNRVPFSLSRLFDQREFEVFLPMRLDVRTTQVIDLPAVDPVQFRIRPTEVIETKADYDRLIAEGRGALPEGRNYIWRGDLSGIFLRVNARGHK